jgi:uncharacterized membrane protein
MAGTNFTTDQDDSLLLRQAKLYVFAIKGCYYHLTIYLVCISLMVLVNLLVTPEKLWFVFPMLGWGIGLAGHWFTVFGKFRFLGRRWEERKVQELIDKGRF